MTPFTYLIRLGSSKHLVLPELDMHETVIPTIYGPLILPLRSMSRLSEKKQESRMLSKCDEFLMIHSKHESGNIGFSVD